MSKIVTIRKGHAKKRISKDTWDAMVKGKATYGWALSTSLPEEVSQVEEKLIIDESQKTDGSEEVSQVEEKPKTGDVTNILKAGVRDIKEEIPSLSLDELNSLLAAEKESAKPRTSVLEAIEKQISKNS